MEVGVNKVDPSRSQSRRSAMRSLLYPDDSVKSAESWLTRIFRSDQGKLAPMARPGYDPYAAVRARTYPGSATDATTSATPVAKPPAPKAPTAAPSVRNSASMSRANPLHGVAEYGNAVRDRNNAAMEELRRYAR